MVRAMRKLLMILAVLPTAAAAQWAPSPALFSYEASFASCTEDLSADSFVAECTAQMTSAYILKRAVAQGFQQCLGTPLRDCAIPFEDAGLPAFGVQIAADIGCETTDLRTLAQDTPMSPDHCVTIASDILSDEGALPLDTAFNCDIDIQACIELALVQRQLWNTALDGLENGPQHDPTIRDLLGRVQTDCQTTPTNVPPLEPQFSNCVSDGASQIWRDLVLEFQD